uniref:hypothetical protein n=1 Tax=Pantoea sp. GbtcB22 TaxID=2824767 RepID=UPI001C2FA630
TGDYGSGEYTDVNTHGATFNVAGNSARAVEISDGAHATIDAATRIRLPSNGATGAVADGNKFTLTGDPINPQTQFNPD